MQIISDIPLALEEDPRGIMVCFCLGITSIDPLKNNLLFERFLNPERVSMPDIDSDIHTEVRYLLIEYVKKN